MFAPSDDAFITYFKSLPSTVILPPGSPAPTSYDEASVITLINGLQVSYPSPTPPLATGTAYLTIGSLISQLNYHILGSKVTSSQLTGNQVFTVQNSGRLSISKVGADVLLNANSPINGAKVTAVDIAGSNGVVHTIDRVMLPPSSASALAFLGFTSSATVSPVSYATNPPTVNGGTTSDANTANFNLLAAAIRKTGLALILFPNASPMPDFTVFAPNDAAFIAYLGVANEAAGSTKINSLNETEVAALANVLKYHVIIGRIVSTDLTNGQEVLTLSGSTFVVSINGNVISLMDKNTSVADPTVIVANNLTSAGVVHSINSVLRLN